jgi:hypothetical protein
VAAIDGTRSSPRAERRHDGCPRNSFRVALTRGSIDFNHGQDQTIHRRLTATQSTQWSMRNARVFGDTLQFNVNDPFLVLPARSREGSYAPIVDFNVLPCGTIAGVQAVLQAIEHQIGFDSPKPKTIMTNIHFIVASFTLSSDSF